MSSEPGSSQKAAGKDAEKKMPKKAQDVNIALRRAYESAVDETIPQSMLDTETRRRRCLQVEPDKCLGVEILAEFELCAPEKRSQCTAELRADNFRRHVCRRDVEHICTE